MKQQLRFLMLMLLCAVFSTAWGEEETITFSQQGYSNGQAIVTVSATNFAIAFDKGTNSNVPAYYDSGKAIRAYGGNTFTVTSTNDMTKIVIKFGSSDGSNAITANTGTYSNGTWTGSANSVTFTIGGTSGNRRLSAITVTTSSADEVAKPVITPDGGNYFQEQKVTITADEGCTIYYTTDGSAPTADLYPRTSPCYVYIASINVEESTTVKAIAVKDGEESDVAEATFYLVEPIVSFSSSNLEISGDGGSGTLDINSNLDLEKIYSKTTTFNYFDAEGAALSSSPDWLSLEVSEDFKTLTYNVQANESEDNREVFVRVYFNLREAESDSYPATSNVYAEVTITQSPKSESTDEVYKLFSGNLTEGDYIIYYDGRAMKNTVSSNNRLDYLEVTPENDVITNPDASIVWHIAPDGDYWTIYNADKSQYAVSTGAANKAGMSSILDDMARWSVTGSSTFDFVNKLNTTNSVNANLRNNGTYGFACYSTSTGGALSLYKYEEASNVKKPTFIPNGGEFIGTQEVTITVEEGCSIYYTTNGNDPSAESTLYEAPFTIDATTTVKAIAVKDGENSEIASAVFTLITAPGAPTFTPESGTTIGVGQQVRIYPDGESRVNGVVYTINNGDPINKTTNQYNTVTITEEMVEDGQVIIEAYHIYSDGTTTLDGTHAIATYTVVNPVVTFETPATIFTETIDVTLSASPEDAVIYYTIDGTKPTNESSEYTSAITLDATTTVKAIAVVNGVASEVAEVTYTKNEAAISSDGDNYVLVTDASTLNDGDKIIIVSDDIYNNNTPYKHAMGKNYGTTGLSNIGKVDIEECFQTDGSIIPKDEVRVLTLKSADDNKWVLYCDVENGSYLYATEGENWLKMSSSDGNETYKAASITIEGDDNHADIVYLTENNKKREIRYNYQSNSGIFSCYLETQYPVKIYRSQTIDAVNLYEMPSEIDNTIEENTIVEQSGVTVNLYRSLSAGVWNAICLPFDMTVSQANLLFGEGYKLEEFSGVEEENGNTSINFSSASEFKAGVPYIVMPTQSVAKKAVVVISGVDIDATSPSIVNHNDYTFQGFYNPTLLPAGDKQYIFIGANNQFSYPNADSSKNKSLRAFRCYFHLPQPLSADVLSLSVDNQGIIDSISLIEVEGLGSNVTNNRVYSISGQCVGNSTENLPKGIYIINGRKFIVK